LLIYVRLHCRVTSLPYEATGHLVRQQVDQLAIKEIDDEINSEVADEVTEASKIAYNVSERAGAIGEATVSR